MGMIARVISTAVEGFLEVTAEIYPSFNKVARLISPPGVDSLPLSDGDACVLLSIGGSDGKTVFLGSFPASSEVEEGEIRLYSRDADGAVKASIRLYKDGKIRAENESGNFELASNGTFSANGTNFTVDP